MHKPHAIKLPILGEIESRPGLRDAFRRVYDFLQSFYRADYEYKEQLSSEMLELYGEVTTNFSLDNGGAIGPAVTVMGAQVGYPVQGATSQPLVGIVSSYTVTSENTVQAVFQNVSGQVLNFNGKIRVWVFPKDLA